MCQKKASQERKAEQGDRSPREGRVQALQPSDPGENVIPMSSHGEAVPF